MRNAVRIGVVMAAGAALAACGTTTPRMAPGAKVTPNPAARSYTNADGQKVGKPYQIGGVWYVPREQPNYDEIGIASWYGPGFHMKTTAMGEIFDMDAVSAAHTTLPLPSMVEVTNLANGRKLVVRVNDRGPFHDGRIIDLSREAARQLGYEREGVARVRVRYLGPPDLLGPKDGVRYAENKVKEKAKNELKPGFKFSFKPSFPISVAPPVNPQLAAVTAAAPSILATTATAAPGLIAATASAVPKVVGAMTSPLESAPSAPRSQPITVATLPPPTVLPPAPPPPSVLPSPTPVSLPTSTPTSLPVSSRPPSPMTSPVTTPVSSTLSYSPSATPVTSLPTAMPASVPSAPTQIPVSVTQTVNLPPPELPVQEVELPAVEAPNVEPHAGPGLRVQAGAFASKANAQRAVSLLAAAGVARIEPMTRADGVTLYRVILAAPSDEAAAYALRDRVEEIGFADAQVVKLF